MSITAAQVKELRERTGAGMMECKKALQEAQGDLEVAIELMRKSGQAKADKRAGRIAAEGVIVVCRSADSRRAAMVEVNCETDFVAKDASFGEFAQAVAQTVLERQPADLEELAGMPLGGAAETTVNDRRQELIARIGENIGVRRFEAVSAASGALAHYVHSNRRIGVLVEVEGGDETLGKDLAMHIAASRPAYLSEQEVPQDVVAKEREIFLAQAAESGKPANIVEKMVEGRLHKALAEMTLLGQAFVKDPEVTVAELLERSRAVVRGFRRFEVGEGVEKKKTSFADEVMAQVRGE